MAEKLRKTVVFRDIVIAATFVNKNETWSPGGTTLGNSLNYPLVLTYQASYIMCTPKRFLVHNFHALFHGLFICHLLTLKDRASGMSPSCCIVLYFRCVNYLFSLSSYITQTTHTVSIIKCFFGSFNRSAAIWLCCKGYTVFSKI